MACFPRRAKVEYTSAGREVRWKWGRVSLRGGAGLAEQARQAFLATTKQSFKRLLRPND